MFVLERPAALFALLLLVPALVFMVARIVRVTRALSLVSADRAYAAAVRRLRLSLAATLVLRAFAWVAFCLALSGLRWGTRLVPVQKSGDAVCLVFDISYSMLADDGGRADNGTALSRLEAARLYAEAVLSRLERTSVAAVLAKGDGVIAVPLTEDYAALSSLIGSLSPQLMSAAGSSLGRGVRAALGAFSVQSAQSAHIWVLTDGDETDGALENALEEAARGGVSVTLLGFGSERGAIITAGDGITEVHTALKSQKLARAASQVNQRTASAVPRALHQRKLIRYEPAADAGSAYRLLQELSGRQSAADIATPNDDGTDDDTVYVYETQPVQRYKGFLLLSVAFLALSFLVSEARLSRSAQGRAAKAVVSAVLLLALFTSCTARISNELQLLGGAWHWKQQRYQQATSAFLQVCDTDGDTLAADYARFGLSATYLMQGEYEAALARLDAIDVRSVRCTPELKSAVYYNNGVLAHQRGDYEQAASLFKLAVIADDKNTSAKVNLELTERRRAAARTQAAETEMHAVAESKDDSARETSIFNLIKEHEQNQWKKLPATIPPSDAADY